MTDKPPIKPERLLKKTKAQIAKEADKQQRAIEKRADQCREIGFASGNTGRVSAYKVSVGLELTHRVSSGRSLRDVCSDEGMPSQKTVWEWSRTHHVFRNQLMAAQVQQMTSWSHDIMGIAEDASGGRTMKVKLDDPKLTKIEKDGYVIFKYDRKFVEEAKFVVDTKKWLMERLASDKYGLKQYLDIAQRYYESTDEELIQGFVSAMRRADVTIKQIEQWLGEVPDEETKH